MYTVFSASGEAGVSVMVVLPGMYPRVAGTVIAPFCNSTDVFVIDAAFSASLTSAVMTVVDIYTCCIAGW